jgi:hypothetical protein
VECGRIPSVRLGKILVPRLALEELIQKCYSVVEGRQEDLNRSTGRSWRGWVLVQAATLNPSLDHVNQPRGGQPGQTRWRWSWC